MTFKDVQTSTRKILWVSESQRVVIVQREPEIIDVKYYPCLFYQVKATPVQWFKIPMPRTIYAFLFNNNNTTLEEARILGVRNPIKHGSEPLYFLPLPNISQGGWVDKVPIDVNSSKNDFIWAQFDAYNKLIFEEPWTKDVTYTIDRGWATCTPPQLFKSLETRPKTVSTVLEAWQFWADDTGLKTIQDWDWLPADPEVATFNDLIKTMVSREEDSFTSPYVWD